jgi:hypothetical protein
MCIPQIETTLKMDFIKKTLSESNLGTIFNISEIQNRDNKKYKKIIFYVKINTNNPSYKIMEERFSNKKNIKVFYNNPLYWKIYEYIMK